MEEKTKRGFAAMDPALQKEIASRGGKSVSKDRERMIELGRKGGIASGIKRRKFNPEA